MGTFKENMLNIWKQYHEEVSADPADLRDIATWALSKRLWAPRPVDITASFAREMADCFASRRAPTRTVGNTAPSFRRRKKAKTDCRCSSGRTSTLLPARTLKRVSKASDAQ
jgi:hypothetical protein